VKAVGYRLLLACSDDVNYSKQGGLDLFLRLYGVLNTSERADFIVPYFGLLIQVMQNK